MRLLAILLLTASLFAGSTYDFISVDGRQGLISGTLTSATGIKGARAVEAFKADKLEATPYIWSGDNIAVNQVKIDAKEAEALQQQAIEAKLKEMALVEISKEVKP